MGRGRRGGGGGGQVVVVQQQGNRAANGFKGKSGGGGKGQHRQNGNGKVIKVQVKGGGGKGSRGQAAGSFKGGRQQQTGRVINITQGGGQHGRRQGSERVVQVVQDGGNGRHRPKKGGVVQVVQAKGAGKSNRGNKAAKTGPGAALPTKAKAQGGKFVKNVKNKQRRQRKERTPEQQEAARAQGMERHAKKIEHECRDVVSEEFFTGEIVTRGKFHAWVKPTDPVPAAALSKLKQMNKEFRKKASEGDGSGSFCGGTSDDVLYFAYRDFEEGNGCSPKPGTMLRFKIYTDTKGAGCCEVSEA